MSVVFFLEKTVHFIITLIDCILQPIKAVRQHKKVVKSIFMNDLLESEELEFEDIENTIKNIAWRIREEREKANISQLDLSYKAGLSQNQVFYIETGRRTPNLHTLLKICDALRISPALLFLPPDNEKIRVKEKVIALITKYL